MCFEESVRRPPSWKRTWVQNLKPIAEKHYLNTAIVGIIDFLQVNVVNRQARVKRCVKWGRSNIPALFQMPYKRTIHCETK